MSLDEYLPQTEMISSLQVELVGRVKLKRVSIRPIGFAALDKALYQQTTKGRIYGKKQRIRETQNALWSMNKYRVIECDCGAKLKLPPGVTQGTITCPRCERSHNLDR